MRTVAKCRAEPAHLALQRPQLERCGTLSHATGWRLGMPCRTVSPARVFRREAYQEAGTRHRGAIVARRARGIRKAWFRGARESESDCRELDTRREQGRGSRVLSGLLPDASPLCTRNAATLPLMPSVVVVVVNVTSACEETVSTRKKVSPRIVINARWSTSAPAVLSAGGMATDPSCGPAARARSRALVW